jgi:predicted  nucleic acid-binding Zn-ribbon protein
MHHEQELQTLRQLHIDAERNMGVALAETLESAETQKHRYENQLRELEHRLSEARHRAVESEMHSQEKAALIGRLESEKQANVDDFIVCSSIV